MPFASERLAHAGPAQPPALTASGPGRCVTEGERGGRLRVFAVIVLYQQAPQACPALRSLLASAATCDPEAAVLSVLLFDNTPRADSASVDPDPFAGLPLADVGMPVAVRRFAAGANAGLAGAYNEALRQAEAEDCEWLLTLDCDTALPADYLPRMLAAARQASANAAVAAIVPHLAEGERSLSPARFSWGTTAPLPRDFTGIPEGQVRAFNSAALLRISELKAIGGFNRHFWLDYLDCWLHREWHRRGKRIFVAQDVTVQHQLSLLDYGARLTPARFRNFQFAESAFNDLYSGALENALYTARLAFRLLRQKRRRERREIFAATWECFRARVTQTRRKRLQDWRQAMEQRVEDARP